MNTFAEDCTQAAAHWGTSGMRGYPDELPLQFRLGQRLAIHIPLHRSQQPQRGSAGLLSGFRAARSLPSQPGPSLPKRVHPAWQAHRPHGPRRPGLPYHPRARAESDAEPKLSRTQSIPSRPNSPEVDSRRLPDPHQPCGEGCRLQQFLSAFVLRPPCSRKWPILGGHGVKSLRRVRSVSTISRFFEFRLSRIQLMWTCGHTKSFLSTLATVVHLGVVCEVDGGADTCTL